MSKRVYQTRKPPDERRIIPQVRNRYLGKLTLLEFDCIDYAITHNTSITPATLTLMRRGNNHDSNTRRLCDMISSGVMLNTNTHKRNGTNTLHLEPTSEGYRQWHEALGENYNEYRHLYKDRIARAIQTAQQSSHAYATSTSPSITRLDTK